MTGLSTTPTRLGFRHYWTPQFALHNLTIMVFNTIETSNTRQLQRAAPKAQRDQTTAEFRSARLKTTGDLERNLFQLPLPQDPEPAHLNPRLLLSFRNHSMSARYVPITGARNPRIPGRRNTHFGRWRFLSGNTMMMLLNTKNEAILDIFIPTTVNSHGSRQLSFHHHDLHLRPTIMPPPEHPDSLHRRQRPAPILPSPRLARARW